MRMHDLGEADRILTILTPGRGIVRATARGARKPKSKLGGHLDLLRHVTVSVREGRNLDSVQQAETVAGFRHLRSDLGRMSVGAYLAELAERFSVEGGSNPAAFSLLVRALGLLDQTNDLDLLSRWFEIRLLQINGFLPGVQTCVECGGELDQQDHVFSPARGGVVCPQCRAGGSDVLLPAGVASIKLLRFLLRSDWPAVEGMRVGPDDRRQVERILRDHLQYVLDRRVKSAAFMDEVRSWGGQR